MPAETLWRLVIGPDQPADGIYLYPDADGGIDVTFRHQDGNAAPASDAAWRLGKPCLERPIGGLGRDEWGDEPKALEAGAVWKIGRLLQWIDAAAQDVLVAAGEPNELPAGLGQGSAQVVGFSERVEDLEWARDTEVRWGFASLVTVPGAITTRSLTELYDERSNSVRRFIWGTAISNLESSIDTVWLLATRLPVSPPWDAPATWADLSRLLAEQGVDLAHIIVTAGVRYRRSTRLTAPHRLLIGFPYAARMGTEPDRIHWIAVGRMPLAGRTEKRKGFRPHEGARRLWDRELTRSGKPLGWIRTENWAPDQLRSRGGAERQVTERRILIIGAGSLGSAVAENLCRAGTPDMAIMDGETINAGNLVRHVLTMADVGHNKADALVQKLNGVSPNAKLRSMPHRFHAGLADDVADAIRSHDVIVDCTGSDDLLEDLATFEWRSEKIFVSLSMTWGAEGLLAFSAREEIFPVIDAKQRFATAPAPAVRYAEANVESIGCWHPVFPADADDVQLWAALGTKFIRQAIIAPTRILRYYRRTHDDGTEVIDV